MKKVKNSELLLSYIREGRMMTQREKLWLIVSLSIPSILAQISATVMFFIDASMVGHLGAKASAAIGLVETTGWLMGGLAHAASLGFSVQVAHFIGANDFEAARRVLRQALVCCLIWALMISTTSIVIAPFLPYWLGGSEEIARDASLYFGVIGVCGIFFQMEGLAGSMLKCSGNMKIPSMLNIGMCVMDVVFNYIFIYILGMGVVGAAIGTGCAELITAILMLYFLLAKSPMLSLRGRPGSFKPKADTVGTAFKIGAPMGLQHLLMGSAQIVSTLIVAPLGTIAIAAHSLAITVESLCYMPGYGIAEAATTLTGQGIGQLLSAPYKAARSADVEHVDERMDVGWRMACHASVHRIHVGQHVAQAYIFYIIGYQFVGWPEELLAVGIQGAVGRAQVEHIHLVGQPVERLHVLADALLLVGKLADEVAGEGFAAFRNAIGLVGR